MKLTSSHEDRMTDWLATKFSVTGMYPNWPQIFMDVDNMNRIMEMTIILLVLRLKSFLDK